MIFGSIEFLLFFLPIFLVVYGFTPTKFKNVTLLSGSLIFYGAGDPVHVLILLISVGVNYLFGLHLGSNAYRKKKNRKENRQLSRLEKKRKVLLPLAILFNVGLWIAFKFYSPEGSFPLGMSFYTFQIISYLVDVRRDELQRETSFIKLATYIAMFPQLISGPIVEYGEVRSSLYEREFTAKGIQDGLKVFTMGLAAKVILADRIGYLWQDIQVIGFESITTGMAWIGAIAFSLNIYFDFYGYSLMAIGLGRILGFELPKNFKEPYMSTSIREFYRRWHMTLGRWFTKYIYIPLGGNRKGMFRTILHLLMVWIFTSLWHGTTLNFLAWGMILWFFIVLERLLDRGLIKRFAETMVGRLLSHLYVLAVIPVTWMCFAIGDMEQLVTYIGRMFSFLPAENANPNDWKSAITDYAPLLCVGMISCTGLVRRIFSKVKDSFLGSVILVALFWFCIWRIQVEGQNPFMYSQF